MIFTISWTTEYRPSGWSFGHCDSCQQSGPVRIEEMVDVGHRWGLFRTQERPLHDSVARCDFCHRQVQPGQVFKEIDLSFVTDGAQKTVKVEIPQPISPKKLWGSPDERLLGAAFEQISISEVK